MELERSLRPMVLLSSRLSDVDQYAGIFSPPKALVLMTKYKGRAGEIGALIDRLDEKIEIEDSDNDYRTTAAIAVDFCELLLASLDANQKDGLMAAHAWWDNSDAETHKKFVSIFAKVIDLDRANGVPPRQAAINRLVWTALNVNGPFCAYMAEFLADLGRGAGLTAKQMTDVFAKYVPGL